MILTKLDQHVKEMMITAGKKFHNLLWSRFLIIVQNVNMVTNGKRNSRLNPHTDLRLLPLLEVYLLRLRGGVTPCRK